MRLTHGLRADAYVGDQTNDMNKKTEEKEMREMSAELDKL